MSKKTALIIIFCILGSLLLFHFLIITQIIPYNQVWAGRLQSVEQMRSFETFSILVNLFMLTIFIIKYRQLESGKSHIAVDILIWVFFAFFLLNTLGNLFAKSIWELIFGTAFTLTSAILCFIIARRKKSRLNDID